MSELLPQICARYQAFLIDICGVLHDGNALFPWTQKTLDILRQQKKTLIFFSNTGHGAEETQRSLEKKGLKGCYTTITSGDVVQDVLQTEYAQKRIYLWGEARSCIPKENIVSLPSHADLILLTAFLPDAAKDEHWDDWIRVLPVRPIICVNPDIWAPQGINKPKRRCAGFLAERVKHLRPDLSVQYFGKPYTPIYQKVFTQTLACFKKKDVLAVGDTLSTDILGANTWGVDSWWIHPTPKPSLEEFSGHVTYASERFQ